MDLEKTIMTHDNTITLYRWILQEFTIAARLQDVNKVTPHLSPLVKTGDRVLDLCCGSGPMSFWFEEQGAEVTAIDYASYMIALAREQASRRSSTVEFIEANVLEEDLGQERYDLAGCFGNSISEFLMSDFVQLGKKVEAALKPGGRFVIEYHDGCYPYIQGERPRSGVLQEAPERVTFQFKEYLPDRGAIVRVYRNETSGEEYAYTSHVYSVPAAQLAVGAGFIRERHFCLGENHFLDIFARRKVGNAK